mmetsp:Transcript_19168/g.37614  ORF Transcript_19168/g.37614 Transcript_19168/m.37614 type:complete len:537 (+) Transcript_19168:111-1721(+)
MDSPSSSSQTGGDQKRRRVEEIDASEILNLKWADESGLSKLKSTFESAKPFPHGCIENFIKDPAVLEKLQEEVMKDELFYPKENDLFSFMQSKDLAAKKSRSPGAIKDFVNALYSRQVRDILTELTGVKGITDQFDLTSSVYSEGGHLLCHDDELSSRRIAYILYLVPDDWAEEDGGWLDLFTVDAEKQPNGIFKRILPKRNSLVFFEVSDRSYHQVAEVLSDKQRHSIGGWFHGPSAPTPADWTPLKPELNAVEIIPEPESHAPEASELLLKDWITPIYLDASVQSQVSEKFESESCVELQDFLAKSKYEELRKALDDVSDSDWQAIGPYHKQRFDIFKSTDNNANTILAQWNSLLRSQKFAELIAKLTSVPLTTVVANVRRFARGCYTLMHDRSAQDKDAHKGELDVFWTAVDDNDLWEDEESTTGGQVVYALDGEEEPLVTIIPRGNMLSMVYRGDPDTQAFVKYVNKRAPSPRFDAWLTYQVNTSDFEEDDENENGDIKEEEEEEEEEVKEEEAEDAAEYTAVGGQEEEKEQ